MHKTEKDVFIDVELMTKSAEKSGVYVAVAFSDDSIMVCQSIFMDSNLVPF